MGKKYTTDEIEVGGHMLDASMMTSLDTVVTDSSSYFTTSGGTLTGNLTVNGDGYSTAGWGVGTGETPVGKIFNNSGLFYVRAETARQIAFGNVTNGEAVRINATGNVGIGTTSPKRKLHVDNSSGVGEAVISGTTGATLYFRPNASYSLAGNFGIFTTGLTSGTYESTMDFKGYYNGVTTPLTIKGSGNIGIGTNNPGTKLHIGGGIITVNDGTGITYYEGTKINSYDANGYDIIGREGLTFSTVSADKDIILSPTGNVGVGTTNPNAKLKVAGDINASGFMNEEGGNKNRLLLPKGASYNGSGSQAGAIKITLPVLWTNTMMRIKIKVFDYSTGESFDVAVGGYNYVGSGSGGSWVNTSAWISSQSDKDRNFTVRFGNDGSKAIVYIGELNSYWAYLKVNVIDVELNHNNTVNDWSTTSWAIGLESSSFQNVSRTHSNCQVNNWKRSGQDVYYASGTGNVGIGTTAPSQKLHVSDGGIRVEKYATGLGGFVSVGNATETAGNYSAYFFGNTALDNSYFKGGIAYETLSSTNGRGDMHFLQNSVANSTNADISHSVMTILNSGNVGIGTTSPVSQLEVGDSESGGSGVTISSLYSSSNAYLNFRTGHPNNDLVWNTANIGATDDGNYNGQLNFRTSTSGRATPTTKMVIKATGNVGIGITNPNTKLHVANQGQGEFAGANSSAGGGSHLMLKDEGSTSRTLMSGPSVVFQTPANADGTNAWATSRLLGSPAAAGSARGTFSIQVRDQYDPLNDGTSWNWRTALTAINSGNVGIGTTSPDRALEVEGDIRANGHIRAYQSNSSSYYTEISTNSSSWGYLQTTSAGFYINKPIRVDSGQIGSYNEDLQLKTGATERVRISNTTGNVGIGTTSPSEKLQVHSANAKITANSTADSQTVGFEARYLNHSSLKGTFHYTTGDARLWIDNHFTGNNGNYSDIIFRNKNVGGDQLLKERLIIKGSTGNVGIGTTSPGAKLEVTGSVGSFKTTGHQIFLTRNGNNEIYAVGASSVLALGQNNAEKMRIHSNGNVGIGTTSPTAPLDVFGVRAGRDWALNNRAVIRLDSNGAAEPSDILFGHTAAANQTSWTGAYWSLSSRGSSDGNKFHFYRASGNPTVSSEAVIMTFDPNLNVGIGTTSPIYKLDVASGSSSSAFGLSLSGTARLKMYADGTYNYFTAQSGQSHRFTTTGGAEFLISNGGNVGIGTTSPAVRLDFGNATGKAFHLYTSGADYYGFNMLQYDSGPYSTNIFAGNGGDIKLRTASGTSTQSTRLTVKGNGNVGIGTTTPGYKLDINGSLHSTNLTIADVIYHEGDTNTYMQFHAADQWRVVTGGNERLEVNNSQVTVANNLQVNGSIYTSQYIYHTGDTNTYMRFPSNDTISWNTAGSERMRINSSGNVGIGTTDPGSYKLKVAGVSDTQGLVVGYQDLLLYDNNTYSPEFKMTNNTHSLGIDYQNNETLRFITRSGVTTVPITFAMRTGTINAAAFNTTSDKRLKTKIKDLSCDNIDVSWKSFEMKDNEGEYRTGVVAQELEQKHPEFVNTNDEGFKSVKYIDLLIAKIAELEARLEKLEK